ncbi:MAG: FAD:protein FMN transferase [Clostridiaceae bacterium]|nr:FAD:protein FMN transferase [Clostridiaceae bacterium]
MKTKVKGRTDARRRTAGLVTIIVIVLSLLSMSVLSACAPKSPPTETEPSGPAVSKVREMLLSPDIAGKLTGDVLGVDIDQKVEPSADLKRYSVVYPNLFDVAITVIGLAADEAAFSAEAAKIHEDFQYFHQLFDAFNTYPGMNNIRTINESGGAEVRIDPELGKLLQKGKEYYELTRGGMNIAIGTVTEMWRVALAAAGPAHPEPATVSPDLLPTAAELREAAQHIDPGKIRLGADLTTVQLLDPAMRLDVGALAKGYAVELVARRAEARGVTSMLINAGGNVRSIGYRHDNGRPWQVAIKNPLIAAGTLEPARAADKVASAGKSSMDDKYLAVLPLIDHAAVTSGVNERCFKADGRFYHHIIDPQTLQPAQGYLSITVYSSDSGLADALTTGLFCLDLETGMDLIESLQGIEVVWLLSDRSLRLSSGWSFK